MPKEIREGMGKKLEKKHEIFFIRFLAKKFIHTFIKIILSCYLYLSVSLREVYMKYVNLI